MKTFIFKYANLGKIPENFWGGLKANEYSNRKPLSPITGTVNGLFKWWTKVSWENSGHLMTAVDFLNKALKKFQKCSSNISISKLFLKT